MIPRLRNGGVAPAKSVARPEYPHRTGVPGRRAKEGHRGAHVLRRTVGGRARSPMVSSRGPGQNPGRFAGPVPGKGRCYPEDEAFPLDFGPTVRRGGDVPASVAP